MPEQSKLCSFFCKKTPPSRFLYSCVFYSDVERQKMLRETDMKNNMDKALEKGEFQVYLQPKIELEHDTIAGAEALVRWHDKEKGGIRSSSSGLRLEAAYKEDNSAGNTTQVKDVLSKRKAVLDLVKSMSHVLPDLYIGAAKLVDADLLRACREDIKGIGKMTAKDRWRASSVAQRRALSIFGNSLITELYIDTALFAQVPVIDRFDNPFEKMAAASKETMSELFDMLEFQDSAGIRRMLDARRDRALVAFSEYFDALAHAHPDLATEQTEYRWSAEKGRVHRYTAITRDLIEKIGQGVYADGTYLPTNLKLQEYYGTAPNTLRRAIQTLENTGLVQKQSQRGRYLVTLAEAREKELYVESTRSGATWSRSWAPCI